MLFLSETSLVWLKHAIFLLNLYLLGWHTENTFDPGKCKCLHLLNSDILINLCEMIDLCITNRHWTSLHGQAHVLKFSIYSAINYQYLQNSTKQ